MNYVEFYDPVYEGAVELMVRRHTTKLTVFKPVGNISQEF